jgi:DNA repair protein REV1
VQDYFFLHILRTVLVQIPTFAATIMAPSMQHPIAGPSKTADLPSFSQIDMDVFNSLPEDIRQELEAEYKPRSIPVSSKKIVQSINGTRQHPPRKRPRLSTKQGQPSTVSVSVSDAELRKLDIDPGVFRDLPVDDQREQLGLARQAKAAGVPPIKLVQRIVIKPYNKPPSAAIYRHPPPQANYPRPPLLKQWDKDKGGKLYFTEAEDVQRVIEAWVEGFKDCPPNARDVDNFAKFLVQSVDSSRSTDVGVEKVVRVIKWWLVLLRKYWSMWEDCEDGVKDEDDMMTSEMVGMAWWRAFRNVKEQIDLTVRKKFGGRLSLK